MPNILAVDTGYGDTKVVFGNEHSINMKFKFPSVIGEVKINSLINDNRVQTREGKSYYVGEDALKLESESIVEIISYKFLEYSSPLFISKVIGMVGEVPDIVVLGLSISQIQNSGHYKDTIIEFLKSSGIEPEVYIVPQGAVAKKAIDEYGVEFPNKSKTHTGDSNYILIDVGFNTLDIARVINGKTSTSLVKGIPNKGIIVVANYVIEKIKAKHNIKLNISEAKEVIDNNHLKLRGKVIDCLDIVQSSKQEYVQYLTTIVEDEFGNILDKSDNMILIGGGAYTLLADYQSDDNFVIAPKSDSEYYNAIGYYRFGIDNIK